jgi:hypothetical protein
MTVPHSLPATSATRMLNTHTRAECKSTILRAQLSWRQHACSAVMGHSAAQTGLSQLRAAMPQRLPTGFVSLNAVEQPEGQHMHTTR